MSRAAPSVDEILGSVATALRGDRSKIRALATRSRKRLVKQAKKRLKKEVDETIEQLRRVNGKQRKSRKKPVKRKGPTGAKLAPPKRLPTASPRSVRLRLPNNRVVRGRVHPAASQKDLLALRRVLGGNQTRSFKAIQHNARSIDALAKSQRDMAKLLAELQARGDVDVLKSVLDLLAGLELKCARGFKKQRKDFDKRAKRIEAGLAKQRRTTQAGLDRLKRQTMIQKLTAASANAQTAAYGQSGSMTARNNLINAANELFSGFAADILKGLQVLPRNSDSVVEWLVPLGTTLVADRVIERFGESFEVELE